MLAKAGQGKEERGEPGRGVRGQFQLDRSHLTVARCGLIALEFSHSQGCTYLKRLFLFAIVISLWTELAAAQSANFFCQFQDSENAVICIKAGDTNPVFRYGMPNLEIGQLNTLSSAEKTTQEEIGRERCRHQAERFRTRELEDRFNASLEGLRVTAEDVRASSETNLLLYKQIMFVYDGLFGRYKAGLQAYQDALKTCRVTPYDVRPDRI